MFKEISNHLIEQGLDEKLAKELTHVLIHCCLTWKEESGDFIQAKSITAFSHSFRQDKMGSKTSGPINEKLAELTYRYYAKLNVPVFAQWEVGILLEGRIPPGNLFIVYPTIDNSKECSYLSTIDVVNKAIDEYLMNPDIHSPTLVIAHKWHAVRCARYLREDLKFDTLTDQENMPSEWDPEAGLLWASNGLSHMISHIVSSLADYRDHQLLPTLTRLKK